MQEKNSRLATDTETRAALEAYFDRPNDPGPDPIEPLPLQRQHKIDAHQALINTGHQLRVIIMPPVNGTAEKAIITYFKKPLPPTPTSQTESI